MLGLLGIGGGAVGLVALGSTIANTAVGAMDGVIMAFAGLLYVFGGYCGVAALRKAPGWLHFNQLFWAIQVPVISSPLASYFFATGGFLSIWLQVYPPIHGGFNFMVGSSFTINFFASSPVAFGVNVFAAAIAVYLARLGKARAA
ncbi:hypothetical protein [Roseateles sp.]|uniref:hypothetical protein n=1 Tax=Roseateles sp. TaxID=1971397 RepID=UPI003BA4AD6B